MHAHFRTIRSRRGIAKVPTDALFPAFCQAATAPLTWLPAKLHDGALALVLNRVLARPLVDGGLAFLEDKVVAVRVLTPGIEYRLRMHQGRFLAAGGESPNLTFRGEPQDFLKLITQQEDPDTLFFQRRLRIEGDTALGLHLKNYLDALEESPLPSTARPLLERLTQVLERYCLSRAS